MSAPRTKRQFAGAASDPNQRRITSYYRQSSPPFHDASGLVSPPLPAEVQSNLITVGMRVRKSVQDGHKTGDKAGAFSLWGDNTPPSSQSPPPSAATLQQHTTRAAAPPASSPRELLPFCGINKVGGLAVQPETPPIPSSFFAPAISISPVPELDDLPGLTSSQETVDSTGPDVPRLHPYYPSSSSPLSNTTTPNLNSKKRLYVDDSTPTTPFPDASEPQIIWLERQDWVDGQVSPRSLAPVGSGKNARVMAVPRGVRKPPPASPAANANDDGIAARLRDLGQENRVALVAGGGDDGGGGDFGEAEFLDYMELEEE